MGPVTVVMPHLISCAAYLISTTGHGYIRGVVVPT